MSSLWLDLRYATRSLMRTPGLAAAAIVTIGLGIGVNAGIFAVLNGILFRDLPAPDARELMSIHQTIEGAELAGVGSFSTSEFRAYRDRSETLSGVLAHTNPVPTMLGGQAPQQIFGMLVSCNYFVVLRQLPALGRPLTEQDCAPGAAPVVVLGHHLWRTVFSADREILGRSVELNREHFTVVAVASEGTYGGSAFMPGYFAPISADPLLGPSDARYQDDRNLWLHLIGRRSDQASPAQVRAELSVIAAQLDRRQPGRSTTLTIERATPMTVPRALRGVATGAAAVLMAAFGFVLLIACANVANLLLARGTARRQEIGIRLSLGAGRARIIRQLLTESMLISIAGGLLGCMLALWSFEALVALAVPALVPPEFPAVVPDLDFAPDVRVLLFAIALTSATGLLFGLAPAVHGSSPDLLGVIRQDSSMIGGGRRGGRLRGALVGVQVALSMVLMIGAGLLLRGLNATYAIEPGFDYRGVSYVSFGLDGLPYEGAQARTLLRRLRDAAEALPGVEAAALASDPPLGEEWTTVPIRLPGEGERQLRQAERNSVTPGYFSLVGIPIVRGRTFTEAEVVNAVQNDGARPVVISDTTARNLWPGGEAVGRTLVGQDLTTQDGKPSWADVTLQVVGVAADAQVASLGVVDPYYVYMPGAEGKLLVRSQRDFAETAAAIRAVLQAVDPSLAARVLPLEANLGWLRGVSATVTTLGTALGVLALALASVGIYGVVSYSVTRRYREIGVRIALGARARDVVRMILRQTMRPVVVGAAIGVAAAAALARVLSGVLFGVSHADPVGIGGAVLVVLGAALAAAVMAARPATHADPSATLRCDC